MSDTALSQPVIMTAAASADRPARSAQSDRVLPILVVLSLIVHVTMFLPSFLRSSETERAPSKEIPVELVQAPPPSKAAPPAPKPNEAKPAPAKPPAQKAEQKPPPKVAEKPKAPAKPAQKSVAERLKDLIGPMPAIALPGTAANGGEAASYSQLVMSHVAKAKKEGRYRGTPGAASVSFTLGDSGEVAQVQIVRPSGDPSLDAEAIAMIKRGAPYPPPPPGGRRDYTVTLRFQALI